MAMMVARQRAAHQMLAMIWGKREHEALLDRPLHAVATQGFDV